jgi:flagellar basal-body rod protein FlgF
LRLANAFFSNESGQIQNTGVETDVALLNEAFLFIQPVDGEVALSKRGDFAIDGLNQLVNGAGDVVLSDGLAPIVLPAFSELKVSENGEILVQEPGSAPGDFTTIAFLATATGDPNLLSKSLDGRIRNLDGTVPDPDQTGKFAQGMLEGSNVNAIEEMVLNMDMQRQFEMAVKLIKQAEDIDKAGTRLMSLPT